MFIVRDSKYGEMTVPGFHDGLGRLALAAESGRTASVLDEYSTMTLAWTHGDHTIHMTKPGTY